MNFKQSMNFINSFSHSGKKVENLKRIETLLKLLGDPQKKLKFVHIAGTNGKGSVLEYCSKAFIDAGIKTGQFTSPYILTYCDRIRINGNNIPKEKVAKICTTVSQAVKCEDFSQFEITFAIALLYFLEENCDIVFLETGIGGRLDATNIIENPLSCVITSISLDHTAILGNTVEKIAYHKLGIAKENVPLILSCNNAESVKKLAEETANQKNCRLIIPKQESLEILKNSIFGADFIYKSKKYHIKMGGEHQIINALTAIETLEILKESFEISDENTHNSLSECSVNSRIEIVRKKPLIIIDGGHNESGIDSLINILRQSDVNDITAVFGMVEGKAVDYAVKKLSELAKKVYCVDGFISNNIPSEVLKKKFEDFGILAESQNCRNVLDKALSYSEKNNLPLIICGSLYLASEMKKLFAQ